MVKYLDRSESLEEDRKELEYVLLAPDEPNVDIKHIALHARGGRHQTIIPHLRSAGRARNLGGECSTLG